MTATSRQRRDRGVRMSEDFKPGLEGVVAFETEIAEPDKEGSALRYRGVDIEDLVGRVAFGNVWGLLVDGSSIPGCRRPSRSRSRCTPATSGSTCRVRSRCSRRPGAWSSCSTSATSRPATTSPASRSSRCRSSPSRARGLGMPVVPQSEIDKAEDDRRAVHDPLARRARPGPRQGGRRLLRLRGRARHERLHLHRPGDRLHRRRRRRLDLRRHRRAVRPAARRRALPGAHDARRRRALRRPASAYVKRRARPQGAADGLRPPRLPRRGPARPRAPAYGQGARLAPGTRSPRRWRRPRSRSSPTATRTVRSGRTWSSGRRWSSTSPRCRRTCSPRCSPAPAPPAGARTSWSRRG